MNYREKDDFFSIDLTSLLDNSFFRLISTLLNRFSRGTNIDIVGVTLALTLVSTFNRAESSQAVINESRLISL